MEEHAGRRVPAAWAAVLLGVHRNTVINRINRRLLDGRKEQHKGRGEWMVLVSSLALDSAGRELLEAALSGYYGERSNERSYTQENTALYERLGRLENRLMEMAEELGREKALREVAERRIVELEG